jgi:hypothetical protein
MLGEFQDCTARRADLTKHFQEWFEKKNIVLDDQEYEGCTFVDCQMLYGGGEPPMLSSNDFVRCMWVLDGPALRTLGFFAVLNICGGRDVVEGWIAGALGTKVLPEATKDHVQ